MWYCYTNLPPIDNFDALIDIYTYYAQAVKRDCDTKCLKYLELGAEKFKITLVDAIDCFLKTESPWPENIKDFYVGSIPMLDGYDCSLYFILKDCNNGITHVISPVELVHLNEYLAPSKAHKVVANRIVEELLTF